MSLYVCPKVLLFKNTKFEFTVSLLTKHVLFFAPVIQCLYEQTIKGIGGGVRAGGRQPTLQPTALQTGPARG